MYDRLRPLSYYDTDIFLLCFSVDSLESFRNVEDKWAPELKHFGPKVPIVLIGTKKDLRDQADINSTQGKIESRALTSSFIELKWIYAEFVTLEQGKTLSDRIGASEYVECSAKTMDGIGVIFPTAGKIALQVCWTFHSLIHWD